MSRIGDLTVRIGADITRLQTGMRRAQGEVSHAVKAMGAVGAAAAAAAAGVVAFTKSSADAAKELRIMASVANTSTQELQRMAFGTRTVGIEQDKLSDILKDVNDRVGDFLNTGGGEMADFFEKVAPQVGVTADQFRNLSGPQALQLYYSTLERANLSQAEMTFYLESMANDATALAPLLRDNGAALQEMADEADDLGIVLSDLDIAMLGEFSKEFERASGIIKGVVDLIAVEFAPILSVVINRINEAAIESGGWGEVISEAVESSIKAIGFVLDAMARVKQAFVVGGQAAALFALAVNEWMTKAELSIRNKPLQALVDLANGLKELPGVGALFAGSPLEVFSKTLLARSNASQAELKTLEGAVDIAIADLKETLNTPMPSTWTDSVLEDAAKLREDLKASIDGIETGSGEGITLPGVSTGGGEGEDEGYQEQLQKRLELLRDSMATEREIELERYQQANEDLRASLELDMLTEEEYNELKRENHKAHVDKITAMDEQAAKRRERLQQQVAQQEIRMRQDVVGKASSLLQTLGRDNKAFALASIALTKGMAIAQTIAHTQTASMLAYASQLVPGDPSSVARAATAALATQKMGAVKVGLIAAQGLVEAGGVMSSGGGGAPSGGGSTGSTASPAQTQPAQPAAPAGGTLTVQGISSSSLFTGDAVRELAQELIEYQKRGGTITIA